MHTFLLAEAAKAVANDAAKSFVEVKWESGKLIIELGVWTIALLALGVLAFFLVSWLRTRGPDMAVEEVTLKFGDVFEQKIKVNRDTQKIAFAAYAELVTRKVALPFDQDHDVLTEVYDSWHQAFGVIRELLKQVPAHQLGRSQPTQKLADVLISLLNLGLRPHLTRWQARYRRWYKQAESQDSAKMQSPQEIQKQFPEFAALTADLKQINDRVLEFASELRILAVGHRQN